MSTAATLTDHRYPIGGHTRGSVAGTVEERERQLAVLAGLPDALRAAVRGLSDPQLDTPYREGGWTVRQLVHHVADSHGQMYGRVKLALTEDWPRISPYNEAAWAELEDSRVLPVQVSLGMLAGIHARLDLVLRSLGEGDWTERGFGHPERGRMSIAQALALYDWHSRHHVAHVMELRKREGWQ